MTTAIPDLSPKSHDRRLTALTSGKYVYNRETHNFTPSVHQDRPETSIFGPKFVGSELLDWDEYR
jgi:hypothetical protein